MAALKSPSKMTWVKGEEYVKIRDQFRLLAYSMLDEAVPRGKVYHELTELGDKVMVKLAGMDAEKKYLKKELAKAQGTIKKMEGELEGTKAALDFIKDDNLELGAAEIIVIGEEMDVVMPVEKETA